MRASVVVDTSALVAMARGEAGFEAIRLALANELGAVLTPVLVEYNSVMALDGNRPDPIALRLLDDLGVHIMPFGPQAAHAAIIANAHYGKGNGSGVSLNLIDLMVYATAKVEQLSILCTGKDFAKTDIAIHPASRVG